MSDAQEQVRDAATRLAHAIGRQDLETIRRLLAPEFVHRTPGGGASGASAFLQAIASMPGEILSVTLEAVEIDVAGDGALATGIQHARVRLDGRVVDDRRGFVDWFVLAGGEWRIRAAVELPHSEP